MRLHQIRADAAARAQMHAGERQTSFQAVYERDVAVQTALRREEMLDIGDQSLVFGRTDDEAGERHYVGRRAVFDDDFEPLVIDWRVPAAEPFYRATALHPMGLVLRRHFLCEGTRLLAIEDEHLADASDMGLGPSGALQAAMERPRTTYMHDIVATIQAEQDEIIRDELSGILVVQGGPGTGKTAVALHRAAYLLYTHRQKLERQGVLVIGPNARFLRYIAQVLPSLGEAGVELATLASLAPEVSRGDDDREDVARLKGDVRMAKLVASAVRLHERAPSRGITIDLDGYKLPLSRKEVQKLVKAARRNRRSHNARRSMLISILVDRLVRRYRSAVKQKHGTLADEMRMRRKDAAREIRHDPTLRALVDEAWPLLTPQALIGSLLSSRAQLREAGQDLFTADELDMLYRADADAWTTADVPLLDEALARLGEAVERTRVVTLDESIEIDELETYGHIIVDEAQDLTPMALRMIARRSRAGSLTLVGDLAQTVGAAPPRTWEDVIAHLPHRDDARVRELTVNYRTPGAIMDVAARVLSQAAPELKPPTSARPDGEAPRYVEGDPLELVAKLAAEHRAGGTGTMVVIAARGDLPSVRDAVGGDDGDEIAVLAVHEAKGLEFDRVILIEPARIVTSSAQGLRALYIALTRATQDVTVLHAEPLPDALHPGDDPRG